MSPSFNTLQDETNSLRDIEHQMSSLNEKDRRAKANELLKRYSSYSQNQKNALLLTWRVIEIIRARERVCSDSVKMKANEKLLEKYSEMFYSYIRSINDLAQNKDFKFKLEIEAIIKFAEQYQYPRTEKEKIELPEKLNQLTSTLFTALFKILMAHFVHAALTSISDGRLSEFKAHQLFNKITEDFKKEIIKEALRQCQLLALIKGYQVMYDTKENDKQEIAAGNLNLSDTHELEFNFIDQQLASLKNNPLEFTLGCLASDFALFFQKDDEDKNEEHVVIAKINAFLDKHGTHFIVSGAHDGESTPSVDIDYRYVHGKICDYFCGDKRGIDLLTMMKEQINLVAIFLNAIERPTTPVIECRSTTNERLKQIKEIVADYKKILDNIDKKEKLWFKSRSDNILSNRRETLRVLEKYVEEATELDNDLCNNIKTCVVHIKTLKPRWQELSLLNKILDCLSFGFTYLYRYSLFSQSKEQQALYRLSHISPKPVQSSEPSLSLQVADKELNEDGIQSGLTKNSLKQKDYVTHS